MVICGGGIVGVSTAYYLATLKQTPVTLIERHEVAGAASGKAGGFLALDWNDGSPVGKLARRSYALHRELAAAFGAEAIGYRVVETLSVAASAAAAGGKQKRRLGAALPGWLDGGGVTGSGSLGTAATTAQVHPQRLTRALWAAAEAAGATLVRGAVTGVELDGGGRRVTGVQVEGRGVVAADAVLIALGPWSGQAAGWLPRLPGVGGQKAHSAVLRPAGGGGGVTAHCVFTSYRDAAGRTREPEIYPRPDGTVYVSHMTHEQLAPHLAALPTCRFAATLRFSDTAAGCKNHQVCGENSETPLPADPGDVTVDSSAAIQRIREVAGDLASCLRDAEVEASQACYLPITADGMPFIGRWVSEEQRQ